MSPIQIVCAVAHTPAVGLPVRRYQVGLTTFPPLFFVALRFAAVAAILLPFVGRPTKRELWRIIVISVFIGGLNFGLVFVGLAGGSASIAGVAVQLTTPFTLILAWPLLGERPSTRVILGVILAFGRRRPDCCRTEHIGVKTVPTLFVVGSALAMAAGSVLTKLYGPFEL